MRLPLVKLPGAKHIHGAVGTSQTQSRVKRKSVRTYEFGSSGYFFTAHHTQQSYNRGCALQADGFRRVRLIRHGPGLIILADCDCGNAYHF
jgi:hypothetical protein